MCSSAIRSSSLVDTPGLAASTTRLQRLVHQGVGPVHDRQLRGGLEDHHARTVPNASRTRLNTSSGSTPPSDLAQDAAPPVVVEQRRGVLAVDPHSLAHHDLAVVLALHEGAAAGVANPFGLGRLARHVVDRAARRARPAARDARQDVRVRDVEVEHGIDAPAQLGQQPVQQDRLGGGPRITVVHATERRPLAVQALGEHLAHHLVRDQLAAVHVPLGLLAEGGALGDLLAEQVPGRDVQQLERRRNALGLRSLAGAGRAEQYHVEGACHHSLIPCGRAGGGPSRNRRSGASPSAPRSAAPCPSPRPPRSAAMCRRSRT